MTDLLPKCVESQPTIAKTMVGVAKVFGKRPRTISLWKTQGMPIEADGTYDVDKIAKWKAGRGVGVSLDTVHDKALDYDKFRDVVDYYKVNRADIFAAEQAVDIGIQKKIKEKKLSDEDIDGLTVHEALNWFRALGLDFGIKYDKERLERGESTENVAVLVGAIKEWKKRKRERRH